VKQDVDGYAVTVSDRCLDRNAAFYICRWNLATRNKPKTPLSVDLADPDIAHLGQEGFPTGKVGTEQFI
jgi:hypothetical protein